MSIPSEPPSYAFDKKLCISNNCLQLLHIYSLSLLVITYFSIKLYNNRVCLFGSLLCIRDKLLQSIICWQYAFSMSEAWSSFIFSLLEIIIDAISLVSFLITGNLIKSPVIPYIFSSFSSSSDVTI